MKENVAPDYWDVRNIAMSLLQQESKLEEIVKLVGPDALSVKEKLILFVSKSVREDFLYQDSFSDTDAYTSAQKQYEMLKTITAVYQEGLKLADKEDFDFSKVEALPVIQKVAKIKEVEINDGNIAEFEKVRSEIATAFSAL